MCSLYGGLLVAAHLAAGVDIPLVVVVLAYVNAQIASLLGPVRAVGALVRGRFPSALDVLVPAQRRLPSVLFTAVPALELAARVVRTVPVATRVLRLVFAVQDAAGEPAAAAAVVEGVRLLGQDDVVRVVVLAVALRLLLLQLGLVQFQFQPLPDSVVVLHERLLQQMRLYVLRDRVERVHGQLGHVEGGGERRH